MASMVLFWILLSLLSTCFCSLPTCSDIASLDLVHHINKSTTNECQMDIILIHGLTGNINTWQNNQFDTSLFNLLYNDPKLESVAKRIWIYQYPSSFTKKSSNKALSLKNRANDLLLRIYNSEIAEDDNNNPILLISASYGGLIVKQLFIDSAKGIHSTQYFQKEYYKIHQRIKGIAFYGTPHTGTELANIYKLVTTGNGFMHWISGQLGIEPSTEVNNLTPFNDKLMQIQREFNQLAEKIQIMSFFETQLESEAVKLGIDTLIVPEYRSVLGTANEQIIPLEHCHTELSKPIGYNDMRYAPFRRLIKTLIKTSSKQNENTTEKPDNVKPDNLKPNEQIKTFNEREIDIKVKGRVHSWKDPWIYDGTARDVATGISVKSKHWKSEQGARQHALQELKAKLKAAGYL